MDLIYPERLGDVVAAVRDAAEGGRRLRVVGGRRHMARAGAVAADAELWTTSLDGIVAYDPAELIVVVRAGTRIEELRAVLAGAGQEWPTDEPDDATVGGVIAAGVDPIRRSRTGLLRDTVVEMQAVLGDARVITSGARVVKNVSGFDVHRLLTGSCGSLGVITQVALKVRPLPKMRLTLATAEGGPDLGARLLGALWQPAAILAEPDRVVVHLEGWPAEVAEQAATVRAIAACDETGDPPTPGVDLFPETHIVIELGVAPSRMTHALARSDRFRAAVGVGLVWVPCRDPHEARGIGRLADAWIVCRAGYPVPRDLQRTEIEERIRRALDPMDVLAH